MNKILLYIHNSSFAELLISATFGSHPKTTVMLGDRDRKWCSDSVEENRFRLIGPEVSREKLAGRRRQSYGDGKGIRQARIGVGNAKPSIA